jgi:hypothetical protein
MPALASLSLWPGAATANTLVNNLPVDTLVTTSIFPGTWVTEGEQVTFNLWLQQANGTLIELTSGIILTLRLPDKSIVNMQSVSAVGIPAVAHTANSGLWTAVFSALQPGLYTYTWNWFGSYLWSGVFTATQHAAP